ncbi:MAG TPA: peptidoglycan DD-metalloendopeptidase family protein [Nevskiaceae bacterium]|nr:peptidoglycan DD-metalloendopeptidase family protein [Nevskiaceae bacterium]
MTRLSSLLVLVAASLPLAASRADEAAAPAAAAQPSAEQSQQQLERVRTRIEAVKAKIDADRRRRDTLQEQVQKAEQDVAQAQGQVAGVEHDIALAQEKVRIAQGEVARSQAVLDAQRAALGRQLRAAYLVGERGEAKLLLNQEDAQKLGRVLIDYDYLNRARTLRVQRIMQQLDLLEGFRVRIRSQLDELTALKAQQQATLATLETARQQRTSALGKLAERIADEVEELKTLKTNEKETQNLLTSLQDVLADIPMDLGNAPPFAQLKGRLPWPLHGLLLADYGSSKLGGKLTWNGLWIGTDPGTPVHAIARGRVAYVGWLNRYGLMVILEHDGGWFSLYGHDDAANCSAGQWVNAGDTIATAGNTGGAEQTGLYFEIRNGADPVNPNDWLARQ